MRLERSGSLIVIPAKAGIPGRKGTAGLPEVPAFAGMTGRHCRMSWDPGLRRDDGLLGPS
jgi:hypothetical protein